MHFKCTHLYPCSCLEVLTISLIYNLTVSIVVKCFLLNRFNVANFFLVYAYLYLNHSYNSNVTIFFWCGKPKLKHLKITLSISILTLGTNVEQKLSTIVIIIMYYYDLLLSLSVYLLIFKDNFCYFL